MSDVQDWERGTRTWALYGALSRDAGHELCGTAGKPTLVGLHSSHQTLPFQIWMEKASRTATEDPTDFFAKQSVNQQEPCYSRPALETEGGHEITKFITTGCRRGQVCKWVGEGRGLSVEVDPLGLLRYFRPDANSFSGSPQAASRQLGGTPGSTSCFSCSSRE